MSIRVMSRVWDDPTITDRAELMALLALADWANDRGECDPSYGQLAKKARITRRYAIGIVARLVEAGTIERVVGAGFAYAKGAVSNRIVLVKHAAPGEPRFTPPSEPQATRVVNPSSPGAVNPSSPTTVNNNGHPLLPTATASPFGVVVVAQPAPPDHDDDAGHASSAVDYPEASEALDTIVAILAANPCRNPEGRALIAWSAIRHAAPTATAADIQAAADDWAERWERIKGHAPDPLQASQLPDVVAGWMKSATTASRAAHGLVPVIER